MFKVALAALLIAAAPVYAFPAGISRSVGGDKMICRTSEVIGSRLQTKKTCMTRSQWSLYEQEMRTTVDKVQALKTYTGR